MCNPQLVQELGPGFVYKFFKELTVFKRRMCSPSPQFCSSARVQRLRECYSVQCVLSTQSCIQYDNFGSPVGLKSVVIKGQTIRGRPSTFSRSTARTNNPRVSSSPVFSPSLHTELPAERRRYKTIYLHVTVDLYSLN